MIFPARLPGPEYLRGRFALVTGPTVEPVTLTECRLHLRLPPTAENNAITLLAKAARELCESEVDRSFIETEWTYTVDAFPKINDRSPRWVPFLPIPKADLMAVSSITYIDTDGTEQTLDDADYVVTTGVRGGVAPAAGVTWPETHRERLGAVTITFTAGYGDAASDVPDAVKAAILLTLNHLFDHRGDDDAEVKLPAGAMALLNCARWGVL